MDPQGTTEIVFDQYTFYPNFSGIRYEILNDQILRPFLREHVTFSVHPMPPSYESHRFVQYLWYEMPTRSIWGDPKVQPLTKVRMEASQEDLIDPFQELFACCSSVVQALSICWCFKSFYSETNMFQWSLSGEIFDYLCCACFRDHPQESCCFVFGRCCI